jgi:hypothetical protein
MSATLSLPSLTAEERERRLYQEGGPAFDEARRGRLGQAGGGRREVD